MSRLEATDIQPFIELAFARMMSKATALGDRVSERPNLIDANSVYGLVTHCLGLTEWWLDHVVLGNPTSRDRAAEFSRAGSVADLQTAVEAFIHQLPALLAAVESNRTPVSAELDPTQSLRTWPWTTNAIVLHVIEELFQHAGHVDISAGLLLRDAVD